MAPGINIYQNEVDYCTLLVRLNELPWYRFKERRALKDALFWLYPLIRCRVIADDHATPPTL